ncbi:MAG TPA: glycosyltransferase family 2 protein [Polyangiaceae bacterium]|jgi:glycosyltransferase involved in cell wall biosynthesis|nr:glycosyltransferase family 2 protein [Polyangiaceae bacterium]
MERGPHVMLLGKKIVVVLPAYNAEKTLQATYDEIPRDTVDEIILVDDNSRDHTVDVARRLDIKHIIRHDKNRGYGGNQKTCYRKALEIGADVVVMLHPDYQYTPKLIRAFAAVLAEGVYDIVLGSRILGTGARSGGMPMYKYVSNRFITAFENIVIGQKLSEYHTGYRGYTRQVLERIPFENNSDDFIFDNQFLIQAHYYGFQIAELTCPTKYFEEASSINFSRSLKYGILCCVTALQYRLQKTGVADFKIFEEDPGG